MKRSRRSVAKRPRASRPLGEFQAIARLEALFARAVRPGNAVRLGIGDDTAVLRAPRGEELLWTSDACVQGVHFDLAWMTLEDVGWRSFQAAVSDIAAMGGKPLAALSNLILPASVGQRELMALGRGQALASRALACPIVGGNIARGGEISVTTTVLGSSPAPLLRSGARAGDQLWMIGAVGLARAGFELLRRGIAGRSRAHARCLRAFRRPEALIDAGLALHGRARAAQDVSDGLAGDVGHLASASRVRLIVEEDALRSALSPALMDVAAALRTDPLELALSGGEDYALIASGPASRRPPGAHCIGRIERGQGTFIEAHGQSALRALAGGFDHFRSATGPR